MWSTHVFSPCDCSAPGCSGNAGGSCRSGRKLQVANSFSTILEIVIQLDLGFLGNRLTRVLTFADGYLAGVVFTFLILTVLYRLVPFEKPAWREALPGALFAALVFELGKTVFSIYIDTVANFEAVYGSVSSIIMLLLWLYFAARVILFGAELIAVRRE